MTTVIISDLHLSKRFSIKKFNYLKKIISSADRIILNGDFWEGYLISFDKFLKSRWKALFPLLKSKETIYIYGNHDNKQKSDSRVSYFSNKQADSFVIDLEKKKILVEHGNRLAPALNEKYHWLPSGRLVFYIIQQFFINLPLFILGKEFYLINGNKNRNKLMKLWVEDKLPKDYMLICGHSHLAELSAEDRFGNTGFIRHGIGQYIRISDDKIELINEKF